MQDADRSTATGEAQPRSNTPEPTSGPSGATDKTAERETKFDEEGGAQTHSHSEYENRELLKRDQPQGPNQPLDSEGKKKPVTDHN